MQVACQALSEQYFYFFFNKLLAILERPMMPCRDGFPALKQRSACGVGRLSEY